MYTCHGLAGLVRKHVFSLLVVLECIELSPTELPSGPEHRRSGQGGMLVLPMSRGAGALVWAPHGESSKGPRIVTPGRESGHKSRGAKRARECHARRTRSIPQPSRRGWLLFWLESTTFSSKSSSHGVGFISHSLRKNPA